MLLLSYRDGHATLERQRADATVVERRERECAPVEVECSTCGGYVSVSVPSLIDAVFRTDGACVYARCAWIGDLSPLGGQCECRGGELDWSSP